MHAWHCDMRWATTGRQNGLFILISFKETLLSVDIELKGFKTFRDHYRYNQDDIQLITKDAEKCGAEWIVTTEKDIMRLKGLSLPDNLVLLAIVLSVDDRFYEEVFKGS
jgi:tetraacyldisaccharide 4'-kinase